MRRKANPLLGCVIGVLGGAFLTLVALVIYAIRGPAILERLGFSLGALISLYVGGGALGGTLVGFLLPLTTWRWGAVLAGMVGALPLYFGAGMLLGQEDLYTAVVLAAITGGIVGYHWWSPVEEVE